MSTLFCLSFLSSACALVRGQSLVSFDSASASSVHPSGSFAADAATLKGTGYWSSAGGHSPSQVVTWTGVLGAQQNAVGVTINWAYGPGEFKILISGDGGNFEEVGGGWRTASRPEVSYQETVMFDGPRNVKALTIAMRSPKPWGYFGINDVALLAEAGPSLFISGSSSPEGELCLVSSDGKVAAEKCLDAIAAGKGAEIFSLTAQSQVQALSDGRCLSFADTAAGGALTMEDCAAAEEANDGRSKFEVTPAGQLKLTHMDNRCVVLRPAGASVGDCDASEGAVSRASVSEFSAEAASVVQDLAAVLRAAERRQRVLLEDLKDALKSCGSFAQSTAPQQSILLASAAWRLSSLDPAMSAIARIDTAAGVDMTAIKGLIVESGAVLRSAPRK